VPGRAVARRKLLRLLKDIDSGVLQDASCIEQ
jgi:hypothetical protein